METTENLDYRSKSNQKLENTASEGNRSSKGDINELFHVSQNIFLGVRMPHIVMNCFDSLRNVLCWKFLRTGQTFALVGLDWFRDKKFCIGSEKREGRGNLWTSALAFCALRTEIV